MRERVLRGVRRRSPGPSGRTATPDSDAAPDTDPSAVDADVVIAAIEACEKTDQLRDIAVFVDADRGPDGRIGGALARRFPGARVHVLTQQPPRLAARRAPGVTVRHCPTPRRQHECLAELAAPQVCVDLGSDERRRRTRLLELLLHVADGGHYLIVRPPRAASDGERPRGGVAVWRTLTRLQAAPHRGAGPIGSTRAADAALRQAIGGVERHGRFLIVTKRGEHAVSLRDRHTDTALEARRPGRWGRTVDRLPAGRFASRASVWTNGDAGPAGFPQHMKLPEMFVREYRDVVCAPRSLVTAAGVLLPISFHRQHKPMLRNRSRWGHPAGPWFVTLDDELADPPRLDGPFYHLDSEFPWGFGHFMGEDMSKLWGYRAAKARHPDLRVLLSTWDRDSDTPGTGPRRHQLALLAAYGIPAADVVCIDAPVRVDLLVGASQLWQNPRWLHPAVTEIWAERREALRSPPGQRPILPAKVFVSRGGDMRRHCRNADDVEQLFADHGFHVVQPETMDMRDQVDLFAAAETVAGFGGSAMFNLMHCEHPGRRIVISSSGYTARNEYLITAGLGGDYHHFSCPWHTSYGPDGVELSAFHSAYEFDFAHDGAALEALLRD